MMLKQLLPLRYRSKFTSGAGTKLENTWWMWMGKCFWKRTQFKRVWIPIPIRDIQVIIENKAVFEAMTNTKLIEHEPGDRDWWYDWLEKGIE